MGGESTAALAIATCKADRRGTLGCGFTTPGETRTAVEAVRFETDASVSLSFCAHPEPRDAQLVPAGSRADEPKIKTPGLTAGAGAPSPAA